MRDDEEYGRMCGGEDGLMCQGQVMMMARNDGSDGEEGGCDESDRVGR